MISKAKLMHHRMQAWLRENDCDELEYLGERPDITGEINYWYRIGPHEVTVDCIDDIELVGPVDEESQNKTKMDLIRLFPSCWSVNSNDKYSN